MSEAVFAKLAKLVTVHAHERHDSDGDIVHVDEYVRNEDDQDDVASDEVATPVAEPVISSVIDLDLSAAEEPPPEVSESRQQRDVALWKKWKESGNKADLAPIMKNYEALIKLKMSPFIGRVKLVPDTAIKTEFQLQFVEALRTYDPEKSSLSTHVFRYMDKAKRYIADKQNVGRIPENRIYKIKAFINASNNLREKLDGEPSIKQLAVELGLPEAEVKRMSSENRADLSSHGFEEDPFNVMPSKSEEVLRLFVYELDGDEQEVYKYLTGYGAKKVSSTGEISRILKLPDYKISRIKASIERKLRKYVE